MALIHRRSNSRRKRPFNHHCNGQSSKPQFCPCILDKRQGRESRLVRIFLCWWRHREDAGPTKGKKSDASSLNYQNLAMKQIPVVVCCLLIFQTCSSARAWKERIERSSSDFSINIQDPESECNRHILLYTININLQTPDSCGRILVCISIIIRTAVTPTF